MEKRQNEVERLSRNLCQEVWSANTLLGISIEEFEEGTKNEPFYARKAKEVPTDQDPEFKDENKQKEVIFLLNIQKEYRIKVVLRHRNHIHLPFDQIVEIAIEPPDCGSLSLETKTVRSTNNECEAVALLEPARCPSKALNSVSSLIGTPRTKYVPLRIRVTVKLNESNEFCFPIAQVIYARMFPEKDSLGMYRFAENLHQKWVSLPLCLRRGIQFASSATQLTSTMIGLRP